MRWAAALLVACKSTPAPEASAPPPPASTAAPAIDAAIPALDLSAGLGLPSPALLERLSNEWSAVPKGKLELHPRADPERDDAIKKRFGQQCRLERTCGPLWGIDCEAAVDGPYFYVRVTKERFEEITTCGGACMGGRCTNCPPKNEGWTCATY